MSLEWGYDKRNAPATVRDIERLSEEIRDVSSSIASAKASVDRVVDETVGQGFSTRNDIAEIFIHLNAKLSIVLFLQVLLLIANGLILWRLGHALIGPVER